MRIFTNNLAYAPVSNYQFLDRTRQGYSRKRILKPAGRFVYTPCVERTAA